MAKHSAWTEDQICILTDLIDRKISLARASVILKRPQISVQKQARKIGKPFRDIREIKAALKASEAAAERRAGIRR